MNNNTLGIVGIVAGSIVALAGIAGLALRTQTDKLDRTSNTSDPTSGDAYGIILQIATPPPQWGEIQDVLRSSPMYAGTDRDLLYRIRRFATGTEQPTPSPGPQNIDAGNLPEDQLLFDHDKTVERLKKSQFTGYAFQIGVGGKESYKKLPKQIPNMPQGRGKVNMRESREMVEEIDDILNPEQ